MYSSATFQCLFNLWQTHQHASLLCSTATQSYNHPSPYTDHARCLDTRNFYFSPYRHHKFDMPWEAYGNYPNQTTSTCTKVTNGLQCHFSKLLPATKVWNTHLECQCFIKYGKPMSYQHHCSTIFAFGNTWEEITVKQSSNILLPFHPIPVHKVYQHLLNNSLQLRPFNMQPSEDTNTLWNLFTHPGIYMFQL